MSLLFRCRLRSPAVKHRAGLCVVQRVPLSGFDLSGRFARNFFEEGEGVVAPVALHAAIRAQREKAYNHALEEAPTRRATHASAPAEGTGANRQMKPDSRPLAHAGDSSLDRSLRTSEAAELRSQRVISLLPQPAGPRAVMHVFCLRLAANEREYWVCALAVSPCRPERVVLSCESQ